MNDALRKALADCLSDMERGAGVEDCLKRHPGLAIELRPHLETSYAFNGAAVVQPSASAFTRGRRSMHAALASLPTPFSPLTAARLAPTWATAAGAVATLIVLLGGAAGTSAALGGPDVARDTVVSVAGVFRNEDGAAVNDSDDGAIADLNQDCVAASPTPEASPAADGDKDRGHGNEIDHTDEDNPGQGQGNHGADDCAEGPSPTPDPSQSPEATPAAGEDENRGHGNDGDNDDEGNPGQGQGNHGTGNNGNANGTNNASPLPGQGQGGGNPNKPDKVDQPGS